VEVLKETGLDVCRVTEEGKLKPVNASQLKDVCGEKRLDYLNLVAAHGPRMESLLREFA
jgi:hypothetical protein